MTIQRFNALYIANKYLLHASYDPLLAQIYTGRCLLPWIYPLSFARAFSGLMGNMKKTARGQPELPESVPDALDVFKLEWDTSEVWHFADLNTLFLYLRKNKKLQIPHKWKAFVPKTLD